MKSLVIQEYYIVPVIQHGCAVKTLSKISDQAKPFVVFSLPRMIH